MTYKHITKPTSIWFVDIETRFDKERLNPRKMSLVRYAQETEIYSFVAHEYRLRDGQWVKNNELILTGKECETEDYLWRLWPATTTPGTWIVAHNAAFDFLIMQHNKLTLSEKFILVDTLAMANYFWHGTNVVGRPASLGLDHLGSVLLGESKLDFPLIEGFGIQQCQDALESNDTIVLDYIKGLTDYNVQDVNLLRKLFFYLMREGIPRVHIGTIDWALKQFIFPKQRLNRPLLITHQSELIAKRAKVFSDLGVDPKVLTSNNKCTEWLNSKGYIVPMKKGKNGPIPALAKTDAFIYENQNQQTELGELIRARLLAKSNIELTRTESFLKTNSYCYHYHVRPSGTFTHRLSGKDGGGGNPLNLARDSPLRNCILPAKNHKMYVFDFSGLELHIARWGANDRTTMQLLRDGVDIYSDFICELLKLDYDEFIERVKSGDKAAGGQRFVGKTAQLSLQYGVGAEKFMLATNASGKYTLTIDEAVSIVKFFRHQKCQGVVRAWDLFGRYFLHPDPSEMVKFFQSGFWDRHINFPGHPTMGGGWQWPSGRELRFPEKHVVGGETRYKPQYPIGNAWRGVYHSAAFQAFCQSCANEVIDCVRGNLIDKDYIVASECYDELTVLVPLDHPHYQSADDTIKEITQIATTSHYSWWDKSKAPPLKIDIATGENYGDAKP